MKHSDELLQERNRLESEKDDLFYEYQDTKHLVEESEELLSEIQNFQFQLENSFLKSKKMNEISSLYSEGLSHSQKALHELVQNEDEIKREYRRYEDKIDDIHRKYHRALQNEEEGDNSKW